MATECANHRSRGIDSATWHFGEAFMDAEVALLGRAVLYRLLPTVERY